MIARNILMSTGLMLASFFTVAASAQDVPVFSRDDAEDVVADTPAEPVTNRCQSESGKCGRVSDTRGFTVIPRHGGSVTTRPSSARPPSQGLTTSRSRPDPKSAVGTGARSREVPLQFGLGSSDLSPQSRRNLQTLASVLNSAENRSKRIRITGHTDRSGTLEANRRISQQRADAVAAFLVDQGVERSRLDPRGRAFDDLLPGLSAFDARNRRVEVVRID